MDDTALVTLLGHLPHPGQTLTVTAHPATGPATLAWHSHGRPHTADVLDCGLVDWTTTRPARRGTSAPPPASGAEPVATATGGTEVGLLPQTGQPLLITTIDAWWFSRGRLTCAPCRDDGTLDWAGFEITDPEHDPTRDRAALRATARLLREAAPIPATRLSRPRNALATRQIVIANRWIDSLPCSPAPGGARLVLHSENGYRLHNAVVLDHEMARRVAAHAASYPTGDPFTPDVVLRHTRPTFTDARTTSWRVDDGLQIVHDLSLAPLSLLLHCQDEHPLTPERADSLACALAAAAAWLDSVHHLAVTAVLADRPRRDTVDTLARLAALAIPVTAHPGTLGGIL